MSSSPITLTDDGLLCPTCGYNLTGLTENRCPECGSPFKPETLRHFGNAGLRNATPWEASPSARALRETMTLAIFSADKLARRFPIRHHVGRAWSYSLTCYLLAWLLFAIPEAAGRLVNPWGLINPLILLRAQAVPLCACLACILCETALAYMASRLVPARHVPEHLRYHFWRGLTHYTSGFTILTGALAGVYAVLGHVFLATWLEAEPLIFIGAWVILWFGAVALFVSWAGAWVTMIDERARTTPRRWAAASICVLVIGLGSVAIALAGMTLVAK